MPNNTGLYLIFSFEFRIYFIEEDNRPFIPNLSMDLINFGRQFILGMRIVWFGYLAGLNDDDVCVVHAATALSSGLFTSHSLADSNGVRNPFSSLLGQGTEGAE